MSRQTETVTLPRAEYAALLERIEELTDYVEGRRAMVEYHEDPTSFLPLDQVERLLAGESPVRIWRERRGMKGVELATTAGLTPAYLSEIESGKKPGSVDAFRRLARVLRLTIDDLLPMVVEDHGEDESRGKPAKPGKR